MNEVVIDLSGSRVFAHAHYVALSRSRSLSGLCLVDFNESKISVSQKVKDEVIRLRMESPLKLCYIPLYEIRDAFYKVVSLNTRSLIPHLSEIFSEPNIQAADMVCLVETWLTSSDTTETVNIPNYNLFRADGFQHGNSRPHRGIGVYAKESINVVKQTQYSSRSIEFVTSELFNETRHIVIVSLYKAPASSLDIKKSM